MTIAEQIAADLKDAARGMVEQAQVERGSRWIIALEQEHPFFYQLIKSFFTREPQAVLDALYNLWPQSVGPYRTNPYALRYVEILQQELRKR